MIPEWASEGAVLQQRVQALPAPQGRALAAAAAQRLLLLSPHARIEPIEAALDRLWQILPPDVVDEATGDGWPADTAAAAEVAAAVADGSGQFDARAWVGGNLARLLDPSALDGEWWRAVSGCVLDGDRYLRSLYSEVFGYADLERVYGNEAAVLERGTVGRQLARLEGEPLTPELIEHLRSDSRDTAQRLAAIVASWLPDR